MTAVLVLAGVVPGLVGGAVAERLAGERAPSLDEQPYHSDGHPFLSDGPPDSFGDRGPPPFERPGAVGSDNESAAVVQTVTYRQASNATGKIDVTHRYRVGENASALVVYGYHRGNVTDADGFAERDNGRWLWDGTTERPNLTVRVGVNRSSRRFGGLRWVDTGNWSLANPRTDFAYRDGNRSRWVYSWQDTPLVDQRTRVDNETGGFAGPSVVYLGPYEAHTANATNQTLRLVRPETAEMADPPKRILEALGETSRQLRVGARDDVVNAFAGPSPLRHGGTTATDGGGHQDFWASAQADAARPSSIWIHEYVHTRQSFVLGPEMTWFREASASYYAAVCALRAFPDRPATFERFVNRLGENESANATLADRSSWSSTYVPYAKGARVLAALDGRVRNATDGNRTLQDVFRRLNERDGLVTYDAFAGIVGNVSTESQRSWLDDHVRNGTTASLPTSPYAYTVPGGENDADGDGVSAAAERRNETHPFVADTDGDGVDDGTELQRGSDPTDPYSTPTTRNTTASGLLRHVVGFGP